MLHPTKAGVTRALARSIYVAHRAEWSVDDAMRLADVLMADPYLETKSVGIEVVARYDRSFSPKLLPKWKRWLAKNQSANWATTDAICGSLIGPLIVAHPSLAPRVAGWARDRNMWVRRAAAVSLIPAVRTGAALGLAYDVATAFRPIVKIGFTKRPAGSCAKPARPTRAASSGTCATMVPRFPARRCATPSSACRKRSAERY